MAVNEVKLDPVQELLRGRDHYKRHVPEPQGEPTISEILAEMAAGCESPMVAIEGQDGQIIGYRCPRCGTTASPTGRTEHGPRQIRCTSYLGTTVLEEPAQ